MDEADEETEKKIPSTTLLGVEGIKITQ